MYLFLPHTEQLQLCLCCSFILRSTASFSTLTRDRLSSSDSCNQNSRMRCLSSVQFVLVQISLLSGLSTSQRVFFFFWVEHISLPFFMMVIEVVVTLIGFTALCFMEQTTKLSGYSWICVLSLKQMSSSFSGINVMIYDYKRCASFFWGRKE